MKLPSTRPSILHVLAQLIWAATAQNILSAIPGCYLNCVSQSGDFDCNGLDIQCTPSRPLALIRV